MPFNAVEVARQIEASRHMAKVQDAAREEAIELALRIYRAVGETEWEQRVQDAGARRWVGVPLSPLGLNVTCVPARAEYCVVASDSSFVAPDKHRGALSHLINVGRVMIHYGDRPAAELDNVPNHYAESVLDGDEMMSSKLLAARCALRELQELYEWAEKFRADVALVDGSLMQLVNVLSKEEQVRSVMSEYFETLEGFREIGVPVVGYISQPASQMVMRAVRMLACDKPAPCEKKPTEPCGCQTLWSIDDTDLVWELLDENQRSPVFEPIYSHLVGDNAEGMKEIVFAYMATQYELVRLEFPLWVAEDGLLDKVIGTILHQCKLGQGYPNALTRAHQFAVLHNADRESYYFLLERAGLLRKTTEKARGKRMTGQAI